MVPLAWGGAYWLRFNLGPVPDHFLDEAIRLFPLVLAVHALTFSHFGLYRGIWRFASLPDLMRILKAVLAAMAICAISIFLWTRMVNVPRSVLPLNALLLVGFLGGSRLIYRLLKDRQVINQGTDEATRQVLIVGAGAAAEMLVRDLLRHLQSTYVPVAIVDDNVNKHGREIQGVRVHGGIDGIPELCQQYEIELILIAVPSANNSQMRRIVETCEKSQIPFRTLPRLRDLVSGNVTVNELREVSIEDLLGREPVTIDWTGIKTSIQGKRVLISGGGGSIGSELCRQIAWVKPDELLVLDRSEFNLYQIGRELEKVFPSRTFNFRLADVCDSVAVQRIMKDFRPHLVYHAAAYKQVPLLQDEPREACRNNVLGTRNMALAAIEARSEVFVMISTDKAVNPANVMGASKRAAEILCQNIGRFSSTRFITVRFGNVLGSTGSVVPLFREQIAAGGPVTVTHSEMDRYFMTISEAAQLILQAGHIGRGGEIFVLKMGEPVMIRYLAEQMILLSGKRPGVDVPIVYTGLRPGEKLSEELFHPDEQVTETAHKKILQARYREVDRLFLSSALQRLEKACEHYDDNEVLEVLRSLVPEYVTDVHEEKGKVIQLGRAKS
jgi:FlaA1/EpsC-like NDP-sugar epimerase